MTRAWKFLDERSRGIFSGFSWPTPRDNSPGPWVEAAEVIPCYEGVHACTRDHLAWWMSAQLWEVELAEPLVVKGPKVVAKEGRLLQLVDEWPRIGTDLAEWAVWRVRSHAVGVVAGTDSVAATQLAEVDTFEGLAAVAARIDVDSTSAAGVAIAQVADSLDDISNPIFACWDAARAGGHAASAVNGSINSYQGAFAHERALQSEWIADRLQLAT